MIVKPTTRELILASTLELLRSQDISELTVGSIMQNCGLGKRVFYNYFLDKYDAANNIYLQWMTPHINANLKEWNDQMAFYFSSERQYFQHTLSYKGQNNLSSAIIDLDRRKYLMHIKSSVIENDFLLKTVIYGIDYMLHGNLGILSNYMFLKTSITKEEFLENFQFTWNLVQIWLPPIVQENIELYPVREIDSLSS